MQLIHGDCLEEMDKLIERGVQVDCILTDPPYGTTSCSWDNVIPFDKMWERLNKLIKPNGAIVLFGSEPFSSYLRMSNIKNYKYDWIWEKSHPTGVALCNKRPLKYTEFIHIFYKKQPSYYPIKWLGNKCHGANRYKKGLKYTNSKSQPNLKCNERREDGIHFPKDIIKINCVNRVGVLHPTQKPVPLLEYLIKTYTLENETVLDFTMGSGSTGIACINTRRNFIGIELNDHYFEIARKRIEEHLTTAST